MKKFFSYIFTFFAVFVLSAAATISLSVVNNKYATLADENAAGQASPLSFVTSLLDDFKQGKTFEVESNVIVEYDGEIFAVDVVGKVDIFDTAHIKAEAQIDISAFGQTKTIWVCYVEDVAYIMVDNIKVKANTNEAVELLNVLSFDTEKTIDTDALLDKLDIPALMGALNNIERIEVEDKTLISIVQEGLINAEIWLDKNDAIESVVVREFRAEGMNVVANINLNFIDEANIDVCNKNEYLDVVELFNNIKTLGELNNLGIQIGGQVLIAGNNYSLDASLGFDKKSSYYQASFIVPELLDRRLEICYDDGDVYFGTGNIKLKANKDLVGFISSFIPNLEPEEFGVLVPQNIFENITLKEIGVAEIVGLLDGVFMDGNKIQIEFDLGLLTNMNANGTILIDVENNKPTNLRVEGEYEGVGAVLNVELTDFNPENNGFNKNEYLDIFDLFVSQNNLFEFMTGSGNVCANIQGAGRVILDLSANFNIDVNAEYYAVQANIGGLVDATLGMVFENNTGYLQFNNIKVKSTKEQVENLFNQFATFSTSEITNEITRSAREYGDELSRRFSNFAEIDYFEILQKIDELLNYISIDSNGVDLRLAKELTGLKNDFNFKIEIDNNIIKTLGIENLCVGEYVINANFSTLKGTCNHVSIPKSQYLNIVDFANNIASLENVRYGTINIGGSVVDGTKVYEFLSSTDFDFENLDDAYFNMNAKIQNAINADFNIAFENGSLFARIFNSYVKIDANNVLNIFEQFGLSEVSDTMLSVDTSLATDHFASKFAIDGFSPKYFLNILDYVVEIKINSNTIKLVVCGEALGLEGNIEIVIDVVGEKINQISINNLAICGKVLNVAIDYSLEKPVRVIEAERFLDIAKTYGSVREIIETITSKLGVETPTLDVDVLKSNMSLDMNIDIEQILEYLEVVEVDANEIKVSIGRDISGLEEDIELDITLKASEIERVQVRYGTTIDIAVSFGDEEGLSIYELIDNILEIMSIERAGIELNIRVEIDGEEYGFEGRVFFDLLNERYQVEGTVRYKGRGIEISVDYNAGEIYIQVENIKVKARLSDIEDVINELELDLSIGIDTEEIEEQIYSLAIVEKVVNVINNVGADSLNIIKKLVINGAGVELELNKDELGLNKDIKVEATIENGKIQGLKVKDVEIGDEKELVELDVTIDYDGEAEETDAQTYLDISTIYESVREIIETITSKLGVETPTLDVDVLKSNMSLDMNIDIEQILEYLEVVEVDANEIKVSIGRDISGLEEDIELDITLKASEIERVQVRYGTTIDIAVSFGDEEGLSIYELIDNILEIMSIERAGIELNIRVEIDGEEYGFEGRVFFDLLNERYQVEGTVRYKGRGIEISVDYNAGEIYIQVENIKVKARLSDIEDVINELELDLSIGIDTEEIEEQIYSLAIVEKVVNVINNVGADSLNIIKKLVINGAGVELELNKDELGLNKDIKVEATIENGKIQGLKVKDVEIDDEKELVELDVTIDYDGEAEVIDTEKYLDVLAFVNNIKALEIAENINAEISVKLFEKLGESFTSKFETEGIIQKQQIGGDLQSLASFVVKYAGNTFNLSGKLEDSTIFADICGFKIRIESNKVLYTMHKILSLAGFDTNEYDEIIAAALNILAGEPVSTAIAGVDFETMFGEATTLQFDFDNVDIDEMINEILDGIIVEANKILININGTRFGFDKNINIEITINNEKLKSIELNKFVVNDIYIDAAITLKNENAELNKLSNDEKVPYIDIKELADLAEIVYDSIKNGVVSGSVEFDFDFNGAENTVVASYGLKLSNSGLNAFMTTTFNGLSFNIYYIDGVFYLDVGGVSNSANDRLQIKATFEEHEALFDWMEQEFGFSPLDFVQTTLGLEEPLDLNEIRSILKGETAPNLDLNSMLNIVANTDLGFVNRILFDDNSFDATIMDSINLKLYWNDMISRAVLNYGDISVDLRCTDYSEIAFENINTGNYHSYTVITNAISCVMNTITSSPLELFVDADIYKNNTLSQYLKVGYQDEIMYLNYYGLKIKMAKNSLSQILSMVLEVLGLDPQIAGIIGEVADTSQFDTTNLQAALPALDFGNPFTMLNYIKKISLENGTFTIIIDSNLFNSTTGKDFEIKLKTSNNKISRLEINNVYTNAENRDYINATIVFERQIQSSEYSQYIDLSNSVDLIRAFINTSQLDDYLIQGKIMLSVMSINAAKIDVDVRVKLDENKTPIIVATLSNYPMIVEINDANTNERGGTLTQMRYRTITIYFKNGELYLKTYDDSYKYKLGLITVATYDSYERITRITPSYLIDNIKYYLEWLLGFTSTIENKINEAIDKSMNYSGNDDLSNIILSYTKSGNNHEIELNLQKLAHNDDIGTLSLTISSIRNQSTGNKDYLYSLGLNLVMLDNLLTIKTDSSNQLYLKNIGSPVDVSAATSFVNNYPYNPYGEYAKEGSGSYSQKNSKTITISLNNNGGTGSTSVSGNLGANMTLPVPTRISDDGVVRTTYTFLGWYDSDNNLCTLTYFPAANMTLTAHWEVESVQYYKTLTIQNNNGSAGQIIKQLQYTNINVASLEDYVVDDGTTRNTYTFLGWSLGGNNIGKNVVISLDCDKTLDGLWQEEVVYYRTATFNSMGGTPVSSNKQLEGTIISLPTITKEIFDDNIVRIVYTFAGWNDGTQIFAGGITYTLTENVDFVAVFEDDVKHYYNLSVNNNNGSENYTIRNIEGTQMQIASLEDYVVDDGTTRNTYTFLGWSLGGNNIGKNVVISLDCDKTLDGLWQEEVVYYRTATFNSMGGTAVSNNKQLEGTTISLPTITKADYDDNIVRTTYTFAGWNDGTQIFSGETTYTLTENVDFVAVFDENTREYHSITIVNDMLGTNQTVRELVGHETLVLPVHETQIVEQSNIRYYFDFVGYKDQNNNPITEYDFSKDVVASANYVEDEARRVYISTLTVYGYDGSIVLEQTKTNGEEVILPSVPGVVEYDENVLGREYHVVLNFVGFSQTLTEMPNHDVDVFTNYIEVSRRGYYTLNIYDIDTSNGQINNSLVSETLLEGEAVSYPALAATSYDLTIGGETGRWVFNGWGTNIDFMPAADTVIKANYLTYYTLSFYDINSSTGQITRQLSSTYVLVGAGITYPTISTTSYKINNSDGSYRMYNYTGWNSSLTTMPNRNLTISANYSVTTYYKVQFDVSWYKPSWWITSGTIKTSPTAPATQYVAEGTEMNLSGYSATIKVKYGINYTYSTKGWSTSKAGNNTTAINKVTVNSNLTLYAVWNH